MKKYYLWVVALILFCVVVTGLFLTISPDRIPVHYNAQGNVDRFGSKYEFLIFPVIDLIFGFLLFLVGRYEGRKGRDANEKIVAGMTIWVLIVFNALWIFFMAKAIDPDTAVQGLGDFSTKGIGLLLMILFILLGNRMPKVTRNSFIGLRTKWSMASDICWQQSQRLGGYGLVACGIAGLICLSLMPTAWMPWILLGIVGVLVVAMVLGSYLIYKKEMK